MREAVVGVVALLARCTKIRMTVSNLDINMHSLSLFVISADGGSNKK